MSRSLVTCWRLAAMLAFGIAAVSPVLAQTQSPVTGIVVSADGKPLRGVLVHGSVWKRCCPYQQDQVITNENGEFRLEHPGYVIHFSKDGLQPLALIVSPHVSALPITMRLSENKMTVAKCAPPPSGHKHVGLGNYGLHFAVPENGVKTGGGSDVDYVRYAIKLDNGKSHIELWFGPSAMSTEPDDKLFVDSAQFFQRSLISTDGRVVGMDSWGRSQQGTSWRQTAVLGEGGAIYTDANPEEAHLFDQIINSICTVPYPSAQIWPMR